VEEQKDLHTLRLGDMPEQIRDDDA
jgi:hypothetical protein